MQNREFEESLHRDLDREREEHQKMNEKERALELIAAVLSKEVLLLPEPATSGTSLACPLNSHTVGCRHSSDSTFVCGGAQGR